MLEELIRELLANSKPVAETFIPVRIKEQQPAKPNVRIEQPKKQKVKQDKWPLPLLQPFKATQYTPLQSVEVVRLLAEGFNREEVSFSLGLPQQVIRDIENKSMGTYIAFAKSLGPEDRAKYIDALMERQLAREIPSSDTPSPAVDPEPVVSEEPEEPAPPIEDDKKSDFEKFVHPRNVAMQKVQSLFGEHTRLVLELKKEFPKLPAGQLLDKIASKLPAYNVNGYGGLLQDVWPELNLLTEVSA